MSWSDNILYFNFNTFGISKTNFRTQHMYYIGECITHAENIYSAIAEGSIP